MDDEFLEIEDIINEMDEVDEEDVKIIREAQEVKHAVSSTGFDVVKKSVKDEMDRLEERIYLTNDMSECYGCAKALSGMKFVFSEIDRILEDGQKAAERLKEINKE